MTQARLAVLQAFAYLGGHPGAEEILTTIDRSGTAVSRATVFNALNDMAAAGLLLRVDTGSGPTRYEPVTAAHHHFVCTVCNGVEDVPCAGPSPCLEPAGVDGVVEDAQVIYRGTCSRCRDLGGKAPAEVR